MNYRGRVMELELGWPVAELRCMAAEMAAEADQEIARLAEANRYLIGISNEAMEDARKYEEARLEVSRLRHEVAMLCGYDSVEEMDAAVGRRK